MRTGKIPYTEPKFVANKVETCEGVVGPQIYTDKVAAIHNVFGQVTYEFDMRAHRDTDLNLKKAEKVGEALAMNGLANYAIKQGEDGSVKLQVIPALPRCITEYGTSQLAETLVEQGMISEWPVGRPVQVDGKWREQEQGERISMREIIEETPQRALGLSAVDFNISQVLGIGRDALQKAAAQQRDADRQR